MLPKEIINGIPILRPQGRFDSYKVGAIDASMETIFVEMEVPRVVVNLMQVNFIDAAAIDALQKWREKAQTQDGDVVLSSLRQTVRMRLNVQTLAQFLMYEDDEQALTAFQVDGDDES
jgi:anti-anti-sigma factor